MRDRNLNPYDRLILSQKISHSDAVKICLPAWISIDILSRGCIKDAKFYGDCLVATAHFVQAANNRAKEVSGYIQKCVDAAFDAIRECYARVDAGGSGQLFPDEKKAVVKVIKMFDVAVSSMSLLACKRIFDDVKNAAFKADEKQDVVSHTDVIFEVVMQIVAASNRGITESKVLTLAELAIKHLGLRYNSKDVLMAAKILVKNGAVLLKSERVGVSKPKNYYYPVGV